MSAVVDTQAQFLPVNIPEDFGGLSPRQLCFVERYIQTSNATASALYAGYGATESIAAVRGSQLLRIPKIQAEMRRRLGLAIAPAGEVLETLTKHARADLTDVLTPDGEFDFNKARRKRILKKLKQRTRTTKDGETIVEQEYEIHDPQSALEKLGRFHRLFEQSGASAVNVNVSIEREEISVTLQRSLGRVIETDATTGDG